MKGMGTNEKVITEIMGNRSNEQRLKFKDMFKAMFGKVMNLEIKQFRLKQNNIINHSLK